MGIAKHPSFVVMGDTEGKKKEVRSTKETSGVGGGPLTYGDVQAIIRISRCNFALAVVCKKSRTCPHQMCNSTAKHKVFLLHDLVLTCTDQSKPKVEGFT